MRAAMYERNGASDVLTVREVPTPTPGPGEVAIRLAVAGVNPTDWKSRAGTPVAFPFQVPGQDGAGTVSAVGAGVSDVRLGERVWVWFAAWQRQWGTAAEVCVVPAHQAVALPDEVPFELGAALGIPALTAWLALHVDGPIMGTTVLVAGGAGAVGHAAIELGVFAGATVLATASTPDKQDLASTAGASTVVDYRAADAIPVLKQAAPDGVSRIVELDLARNLQLDLTLLAPHGVITSYAGGPVDKVPTRELMVRGGVLRYLLVYTAPDHLLTAAVAGIGEALAAGALTRQPETRFDLSEAAAAHDAVEGGAVGKVLIDLG